MENTILYINHKGQTMIRSPKTSFILFTFFFSCVAWSSIFKVEPSFPKACQKVKILYNGDLLNNGQISLHWGIDDFRTGGQTQQMQFKNGYWETDLTIPCHASRGLDFVFKNEKNQWDNNSGTNYHQPLNTNNGENDHFFQLGAVYTPQETTFSLWSDQTSNVQVALEGARYTLRKIPDFDGMTDIYSVTIPGDHRLKEYRFYVNNIAVSDPYGVMINPKNDNNIVMDLSNITPKGGWVKRPILKEREDSIIYEVHIRDFTIDAQSGVNPQYRGKFLGMVQDKTSLDGLSTGIAHLKELGVTHVQILPFYDFATRHYNWGYDPKNYNIPEEQYSLDPNNYEKRIYELKTMINEFHKHGIRVIMDVVYNHTYTEDVFKFISKSYYDGLNLSGVGNSIDSGNPMVARFIRDSLEFWVKEYNIDGFRFDLIGIFYTDVVRNWGEYLNQKYPDRNLLMFGEPWNGYASDPNESKKVRLGTTAQMISGHVGVFNGKYREAIKGDNDGRGKGYIFNVGDPLYIQMGVKGSLRHVKGLAPLPDRWDPMFAYDPEQSINYISAHDNLCLWDKIRHVGEMGDYGHRLVRFGVSIVLTSQGIPFLHAGDEFLRTKVHNGDWTYAHNSYNAPDEYNMIRWKWKKENRSMFEFHKGLIELRKKHPGLRLTSFDQVNSLVKTRIDGRVVITQIDADKNGDSADEILLVYNPGPEYWIELPPGNWTKSLDVRGVIHEQNQTNFSSCPGSAVTIFMK